MPLFVIGLNHRTAPIEVRERIAFAPDLQRGAVESIKRETGAAEAALLSTCNRTEVYLRADDVSAVDKTAAWLAATPAAKGQNLQAHLYRHSERDAARHAFRVASGLDSMILGEPQVLGQIKLAARIASEAQALGGPLNRLFQETFSVAKDVRSQTAIGATSVSMSAAAVKLAQQLFGDIRELNVLLIGAGEMVELAATHFAAFSPKAIVVANRTLERGAELAARFNATAITLQQLPERIHEFDAVVTSTASTLPLVGKGMIERAMKLRRRKPMFLVDLAVPRDIEAEVGQIPDVFLHTLDSLGRVIQQNLAQRESAIAEAEVIIATRTDAFMQWLAARGTVPVIQQLRSTGAMYRDAELQRAQKLLQKGTDPAKVLEMLATGLTNKFLHHPMQALNRASESERAGLSAALEKLYPDKADSADTE